METERDFLMQILHTKENKGEDSDIFGMNTVFRRIVSKAVGGILNQGKWFAFCTKSDAEQEDVMSLVGEDGRTLTKTIADLYYPASPGRTGVYKFLMNEFLCYVEVPSSGYASNRSPVTKYLVTSNIFVVAEWLGLPVLDAAERFERHFQGYEDRYDSLDLIPYLKLYVDKKTGLRRVTVPRTGLDLGKKGTRVVPLFALKQGVDYLYNLAKTNFLSVTFRKDNGEPRNICTTFDEKKVREVYGEGKFYHEGIAAQYNGDFLDGGVIDRGYIRVIEIGGSKYDDPTRSINYARIAKWSIESEPDLAFVDIDIETSLAAFLKGVAEYYTESADIIDMLETMEIGANVEVTTGRRMATAADIQVWARNNARIISTPFKRSLALFMMANPQWFPTYTGTPQVYNAEDFVPDVGEYHGFEGFDEELL